MSQSRERIGLIAGSGALAEEVLASARGQGREVAVGALSGPVRTALGPRADAIVHLPPSQPKKIIRFFPKLGLFRLLFFFFRRRFGIFNGVPLRYELLGRRGPGRGCD